MQGFFECSLAADFKNSERLEWLAQNCRRS